jgi:hypothetical protein
MGRFKGWNLGMVEAGLVVTYGLYIGDTAKAWHVLRACEDKFHDVPDTMARLAGIKKHLKAKSLNPAPSSMGGAPSLSQASRQRKESQTS